MKKIIITFLIVVVIGFSYCFFIEPQMLFVKETGEGNLKIAIFSDLHLGIFFNTVSLERVVNKVNSLDPDLIFILGDFVFRIKDIEKAFKPLENLEAPVFAVLGNHDVGMPGEDVSEELNFWLEKYGVKVLDNEVAVEKGLTIIGLGDFFLGDIDYELLKTPGRKIVLCHNPDTVHYFPENTDVEIVFCGHTHGGQIRIPFLYKKMIPTIHKFDKDFAFVNNIKVFITSGIGMTGFPFRFLNPPEIVLMEI